MVAADTEEHRIVHDIMSKGQLKPEPHELRRLLELGKSHAEIARLYAVKVGTVKSWVSRAGLATRRPRYEDVLPWRVKTVHRDEYPARMLRLLGRRLSGNPMTPKDARRLDSFLARLQGDDEPWVVAYAPWMQPGFIIQRGEWIDGKIPIQREEIPEPQAGEGGRHKRYIVMEEDPSTGIYSPVEDI